MIFGKGDCSVVVDCLVAEVFSSLVLFGSSCLCWLGVFLYQDLLLAFEISQEIETNNCTRIEAIEASVAPEVKSSTNWKVGGSIPGSYSLHVEVSSGKILNPKLLPKAVPLVD